MRVLAGSRRTPFLRIPPFPFRQVRDFTTTASPQNRVEDEQADELIDLLRKTRVGGSYWGRQPEIGSEPYRLVRGLGAASASGSGRTIWWLERGPPFGERRRTETVVEASCDPWHLLARATDLTCRREDLEAQLLAGLVGVPVRFSDQSEHNEPLAPDRLRHLLHQLFGDFRYQDPFTGASITHRDLVLLCSEWRRLIDSNRDLAGIYGFARWKRKTTAPLLWGGGPSVPFDRPSASLPYRSVAGLWRSRVSHACLGELEARETTLVEIEDGFIRSAGLGANCVPPQSILVDRTGVHFDPRQPSDLEQMLETADLSPELLARAEVVRERIVALGLSKYDMGQERLERRSDRPHILVPGQVEDDRAVLAGADGVLGNLELLRRVRAAAPTATIIYKPHPDVISGHRRGALSDRAVLDHADELVYKPGISSWIDLVDEVHVNSSLAGFEALLRGKSVTTHGVPFYAGWGLTRDLGTVPPRRTRRRSLPELVAICLLLYPRYVDPVTNLPCSLETLIDRMSDPRLATRTGPLVTARRLQGWLKRLPFLTPRLAT